MRRRISSMAAVLSLAITATTAAAFAVAGPAAADDDDPPFTVPEPTLAAALDCPSEFVHPEHEPVLLVHGTSLTYSENFGWNYVEALGDDYDVCGVNLPGYALVDIQTSAEYVAHAIQQIHAATGSQVDVVGHSQGPLEARWALRWWPSLSGVVDDLVMLATPNHGGVFPILTCALTCSPAGKQVLYGSAFLAALNSGDETPGTTSYTSIQTLGDELILDPTSPPVVGGTNITLQSVCPAKVVTHYGMVYDATTYQLVVDALSHPGGADPSRLPPLACLGVFLPGVTATEAALNTASVGVNFALRIAAGPMVATEPPLRPYVTP